MRKAVLWALMIALIAPLCIQPITTVEAAAISYENNEAAVFDVNRAAQDGYIINHLDNGDMLLYSDYYGRFITPYDANGFTGLIQNGIYIDMNNDVVLLNTWLSFVLEDTMGIQSISFVIGDFEYEFIDLYYEGNIWNSEEYWI